MNDKVKVISHCAGGYRKTGTYITAIWQARVWSPTPAAQDVSSVESARAVEAE